MDPGASYTRHSTANRTIQPVAIVSVNLNAKIPEATGITRTREYVPIDISQHVGAIQVVPAVGQQWLIVKDGRGWKLERQLPFNIPLTPMVEGQTRIGSSGPTELGGSLVNLTAPLSAMTSNSSERPSASSVPVGSHIYDTTLNKPIWSDGTNWLDAAGSVV